MAVCSSCGKAIKKGEQAFWCDECYNIYCTDCGYQYRNEDGQYICMNCKYPLKFVYCTF